MQERTAILELQAVIGKRSTEGNVTEKWLHHCKLIQEGFAFGDRLNSILESVVQDVEHPGIISMRGNKNMLTTSQQIGPSRVALFPRGGFEEKKHLILWKGTEVWRNYKIIMVHMQKRFKKNDFALFHILFACIIICWLLIIPYIPSIV